MKAEFSTLIYRKKKSATVKINTQNIELSQHPPLLYSILPHSLSVYVFFQMSTARPEQNL